ncbi:HNH endonuclease, partial [Nostoc sp.]|uniref:HNH endonuclease n=1 Tax=Nostoc sp. TaxID=1180 RepID=UPI002FF524DD
MFDEKVYLKDKDKFSEEPALKHKEHIIQNALIGRLKPNNILCKVCGNKLNDTIDRNFVNIFASITEILQKK